MLFLDSAGNEATTVANAGYVVVSLRHLIGSAMALTRIVREFLSS